MNKKQYSLLVVLVVVSGIIGGGLSNWIIMGDFAFAKKISNNGLIRESVVTTEELRLVDKEGNEHITIGMGLDGEPRIVFWNKENNMSSVILGLNKDNVPGLVFWDNNGKSRATLLLSENGEPRLRFIDGDGRTNNITLGKSPEGESGLSLFDGNGTKRAEFTVASDEAALGFLDKNGVKQFGFGMLTDSFTTINETPMLYLRDKGEQAYWKWVASR